MLLLRNLVLIAFLAGASPDADARLLRAGTLRDPNYIDRINAISERRNPTPSTPYRRTPRPGGPTRPTRPTSRGPRNLAPKPSPTLPPQTDPLKQIDSNLLPHHAAPPKRRLHAPHRRTHQPGATPRPTTLPIRPKGPRNLAPKPSPALPPQIDPLNQIDSNWLSQHAAPPKRRLHAPHRRTPPPGGPTRPTRPTGPRNLAPKPSPTLPPQTRPSNRHVSDSKQLSQHAPSKVRINAPNHRTPRPGGPTRPTRPFKQRSGPNDLAPKPSPTLSPQTHPVIEQGLQDVALGEGSKSNVELKLNDDRHGSSFIEMEITKGNDSEKDVIAGRF